MNMNYGEKSLINTLHFICKLFKIFISTPYILYRYIAILKYHLIGVNSMEYFVPLQFGS